MSKPEITILILSLSQSTDSFKELVSTLLLSLGRRKESGAEGCGVERRDAILVYGRGGVVRVGVREGRIG